MRTQKETSKVIFNTISEIRTRVNSKTKYSPFRNQVIKEVCEKNNINEHGIRMIMECRIKQH